MGCRAAAVVYPHGKEQMQNMQQARMPHPAHVMCLTIAGPVVLTSQKASSAMMAS